MDKFIEIQINRELTPKGDQFLLINVNHISAIGEMDGYATIGLAGEEGVITCENSYEEVKRRVLSNMWVKEHPEEAIKLIEKWSNENPIERGDNCNDND